MRHGLQIIIIVLMALPLSLGKKSLEANPYWLSKANDHYARGEFETALKYFEAAVKENPTWVKSRPVVLAKMATAYFYTGQYARSVRLFNWLEEQIPEVKDHLLYFKLRALLAQKGTVPLPDIKTIEQHLQGSPLQPYVDSVLAEYYWKNNEKDSAFHYFRKMSHNGQSGKALFLQTWIERCDSTNAPQLKYQLALAYIQRFPYSRYALKAATMVQNHLLQFPEAKGFRRLFAFLIAQKKFKEARTLLTSLKGKWLDGNQYTKYSIQLKYKEGNYQQLLHWLKQNRSRFTDVSVLQVIDLHLARCYLRTGQTDAAIKAYLTFQRRYPKAKLAPEVLWKVATLYESRKAFAKAQQIYQKLVQRYPKSEFYGEAILRIGLIDYHKKQFRRARQYWTSILSRVSDVDFSSRLRFWIAKAFLAEGKLSAAWNMFARIAQDPFRNYYTLKAYFLMRSHPLHNAQIDSLVYSIPSQNKSTLNQYFHRFKRFWIIHQIWGTPFSRWAFRQMRRQRIPEWEYYYALGELAEKVGWYEVAFAVYRDVYFSFFQNKRWTTWRFLLKKLYPLYYQSEVEAAAQQWQIPAAVIWAVMKKESSFQRDAVSYANAHGLMQLLPSTARHMGQKVGIKITNMDKLYNPEINIMLGAAYLRQLHQRLNNNWYWVFAAYNAGPHRVQRWRNALQINDDDVFMETIEFDQTRRYVRVVMRYYWIYSLLLNPGEVPKEILAHQ